jgi:hypothetical protein
VLDSAADHVELALERVLVGHVVARADEQLRNPRRHRARRRATCTLVDGHVAPAQDMLPFGLDAILHQPHCLGWVTGWHETNGNPIAALLG